MCVNKFLTSANLILTLAGVFSEQLLSEDATELSQIQYTDGLAEGKELLYAIFNENRSNIMEAYKRKIRSAESSEEDDLNAKSKNVTWARINEHVDTVIPLFLVHLSNMGIEELQLPDMEESISLTPLFITYKTGLFLSNGIVYNVDGVHRYGDAFMTYANKSFVCRFNLILNNLQFEYDFLLKFMAIEGYGKVIGSLNDVIVYSELAIDVTNITFKLNDFSVKEFRNLQVQLDQIQVIRQISGLILTPILNLFKTRITTSISDGLKDQMQMLMTDFNHNDPLQLQTFAKNLVAGLLGQSNSNKNNKV